jgi:hypothetical protein
VGAVLIVQSRERQPECRFNPTASGCFTGGAVVSAFASTLVGAFALGQAAPNFAAFGAAQVGPHG